MTLNKNEIYCPQKIRDFEYKPRKFWLYIYFHERILQSAIVKLNSKQGQPSQSGISQNRKKANLVEIDGVQDVEHV
jgi:hypothetical protein